MPIEELVFGWNDLTLSGALHLPDSDGQHPVVLMLQGSGPSDRDSNGFFPPIRDAFLAHGVATYAFDKPGCGESTGDWRGHGLYDRADQAMAALGALKEHPAVDPRTVGIWGHSQGGWLVQIIAGRIPGLAFAVANSAPSIAGPAQDLYGCEHMMRSQGYSDLEIERALSFIERVHAEAASGVDFEVAEETFLRSAREEDWYGYLTVDDAETWELIELFVNEGYDPVEALPLVNCPFLAIYGGLDLLLPVWRSAAETGSSLNCSPAVDVSIVVFPGGDHRIQRADTGDFVTGYLDLMGQWVARRVGRDPLSPVT